MASFAQVASATYGDETTRYPHGVLGDTVEFGSLRVELVGGKQVEVRLPATLVFEDIAPRLWDVTGDGAPEIVTIESHQQKGARLSIWTVNSGRLEQLAATPFIGTRFRWLAPIGAADFDGDDAIEIAFVDRPHLAKTVRVWRYSAGELQEIATAKNYSNHKIGWDFIVGGLRACEDRPEMILATGNWTHVVALRLEGGQLKTTPLARYSDPASVDAQLTCP